MCQRRHHLRSDSKASTCACNLSIVWSIVLWSCSKVATRASSIWTRSAKTALPGVVCGGGGGGQSTVIMRVLLGAWVDAALPGGTRLAGVCAGARDAAIMSCSVYHANLTLLRGDMPPSLCHATYSPLSVTMLT